jgi:plastocyanin
MFNHLPHWFRPVTVVVALTLMTFLVTLQSGVVRAYAQQTFDVQVVDFEFQPGNLTIPAGATVTWTNAGQRTHTVSADDGSFDSGRLDPGETFSHTFAEPGTYSYHCGFHPEMQGTITVTAAEASTTAATPVTPLETTAEPSTTVGASQELTPEAETRLAHIHAGTCDELGIVVYSLPDLKTYRLNQAESGGIGSIELITGTANVPLGDLFSEPFSIHVHESAKDKQVYLACANVGGRPDAPWSEGDGLILEAQEQNESGYHGFATLRPTPNGETQITIALAVSEASVEAAAQQEQPPAPTTYTSPSFGYTISYGPAWQESESATTNGSDRFVLFNGTSYITFTSETGFGGDPKACVDGFVAQLTSDPNVSNLKLAVDNSGAPLEGGTAATGAYATYDHDYKFSDRTEPYTLYVGCIPLVANEAVLAIVQNVPTAEYAQQVPLREALLRGLVLPQ